MDEFIYYFYNFNVETATTEIFLPGWQKLTQEEIEIFRSGNYSKIEKVYNHYCFSDIIDLSLFNLTEFKNNKISDLSQMCLAIGDSIAPNYKFDNCLLSKEMEENGETPIYSDWREKLNDYKNKRIFLRNEFYRIKSLIEKSESREEIEILFTPNILNYEA